ncbi:MAG: hypothetical protein NC924_02675 [Candidatus Omnitrophica bacterium]|nr:hypothetical protein [Candidatus Omnitrophota bacterium]
MKNRVCMAAIGAALLIAAVGVQAADTAQDSLVQDLKVKSAALLDAHQYTELLAYLAEQKKTQEPQYQSLIAYYEVMATSLYLDYLEQQEDWKNYYEQINTLNPHIIRAARDFAAAAPDSELTVYVQYFAWKALLREEDEAEAGAFEKLVELLVRQVERSADVGLLKTIADTVNRDAGMERFNRIYDEYARFLQAKKATAQSVEYLAAIAAEYYRENFDETALAIYRHYVSLVYAAYPRQEAVKKILAIADLFRHTGFVRGRAPEFAEELYAGLHKAVGTAAFDAAAVVKRAFNVEMIGDYAQAVGLYEHFLQAFPADAAAAEVVSRLGVIAVYQTRQPDIGAGYFDRVIQQHAASGYVAFALYQRGLLAQWQDDAATARQCYAKLAEAKTVYAAEAQKRLEELNTGAPLAAAVKDFFEHLFKPQREDNPLELTLRVDPMKGMTGQAVDISATAQDFSAGTVQPSFQFDWYGDAGEKSPDGGASWQTQYAAPGIKIIGVCVRAEDTATIACAAPCMYEVRLSGETSVRAGEPLRLSAEIYPEAFETQAYRWAWRISGPETVIEQGPEITLRLSSPGAYAGEAVIYDADRMVGRRAFTVTVGAP